MRPDLVRMLLDADLGEGLGVSRDGSQFVFLHEFFSEYFRRRDPEAPTTAPPPRPAPTFLCMRRDGRAATGHDDGCHFVLNPAIRPLGLGGGFTPPSVDWLLRNLLHVHEPHRAVGSALLAALHEPMASVLAALGRKRQDVLEEKRHE